MNNNQQPKTDPKGKAITSFVLGIITIISPFVVLFFLLPTGPHAGGVIGAILVIFGALLIFAVIGGSIGLILGAIALRSTKKSFALIGIIICIIVLMVEFFFFFLFLPRS